VILGALRRESGEASSVSELPGVVVPWRVVIRHMLCLLALASVVGCGSTDLPAGWSGAARIDDFTQTECNGSAFGGPAAVVGVEGVSTGVELDYEHASFRCSQDVEGFLRRSEGTLDVLVQPVDMDPDAVARCSCLYDIHANLDVAPGTYSVNVFRRGDNKSGQKVPVQVGSAEATVPGSQQRGAGEHE
jgi:hypothetical protein